MLYLLGYFLYSLHITGATVSLPLPHHGSQERYLIRCLIIAYTYISRTRKECDSKPCFSPTEEAFQLTHSRGVRPYYRFP